MLILASNKDWSDWTDAQAGLGASLDKHACLLVFSCRGLNSNKLTISDLRAG